MARAGTARDGTAVSGPFAAAAAPAGTVVGAMGESAGGTARDRPPGDGCTTVPGPLAGPFAASSVGARPGKLPVLTGGAGGTGVGCLRASARARFAASLSGSKAGGSVGNLT